MTSIADRLPQIRAARVEVTVLRVQHALEGVGPEEVACLRQDPQVATHMWALARTLGTLASAVGPETVSLEDADRESVYEPPAGSS